MEQGKEAADRTESLLQGLIAECGEMIRAQLRPAIEATDNARHKVGYADAVVALVRIGARAGEAIARLRGGGGPQTQHRIIVERLGPGQGGGGKG